VFLAISCIVFVWAIYRILRFFGPTNDMMPNKVTIVMHVLAFLLLALVNIFENVTYTLDGLKPYEISTIF